MSEIPQELNWVQVRAACSLAKVFELLRSGVRLDVQDRNAVADGNQSPFEVDGTVDSFTVRRHEKVIPAVQFALETNHILVGERKFTVGLNDEGRCVLKHNGKEYEQWQIRKTALESLFFPMN